jgi:flagellar biosynthetic protein FliQ
VLDLLGKALILAIIILLPLLGVTMIVSVLISIVQAATQIQEMTLTFIPKLFITLGMMLLAGPWIMRTLITFTTEVIKSIPSLIH